MVAKLHGSQLVWQLSSILVKLYGSWLAVINDREKCKSVKKPQIDLLHKCHKSQESFDSSALACENPFAVVAKGKYL